MTSASRGPHPGTAGALATADLAELGRFAHRARLTDVPPDVIARTRLLLLDTLGAVLGGLRYPEVRELARRLATSPPAAQTGPPPLRAAPPFGVLVTLGSAATWLDTDSGGAFHPQGHRLPPVPTAHPAPHVLPVLLYAAAGGELDDQRLLEVFLVANEIGLRVGTACSLRPGLHPHGIHGPGAASIAAGLLRGLSSTDLTDALVLGSALPLAATLAVPTRGGTVRNLWTGLGAYYGASAPGWVAAGASPGAGLFGAIYNGAVCTELSAGHLLDGVGIRWEIAQHYLKPYACARWIHPALDAWTTAVEGTGVTAADVDHIEVDTFAFAASLDATRVDSDLHARFSLPYCLATLAIDGELHAPGFLPDRLARSEVAELAGRVRVREDPAFSAALPRERPTRVTVATWDGRTLRAEVRQARGNPDTPLTVAEVVEKFRRNVGDTMPGELVSAVIAELTSPDAAGVPSHAIAQVSSVTLGALGD